MQRTGFGDTMRDTQAMGSHLFDRLDGAACWFADRSSFDYVRLDNEVQILPEGQTLTIPEQDGWGWVVDERPWWERSSLDQDRNKIHDSLQESSFITGIGLSRTEPKSTMLILRI